MLACRRQLLLFSRNLAQLRMLINMNIMFIIPEHWCGNRLPSQLKLSTWIRTKHMVLLFSLLAYLRRNYNIVCQFLRTRDARETSTWHLTRGTRHSWLERKTDYWFSSYTRNNLKTAWQVESIFLFFFKYKKNLWVSYPRNWIVCIGEKQVRFFIKWLQHKFMSQISLDKRRANNEQN